MRELIDELNDICETEVNMPLSSMTTLRIGGYAKYVVYPNSDIALDGVLRLLKLRNIPYQILESRSLMLEGLSSDFYSYLQYLVYPEDKIAFANLLKSPFVRVSDSGFKEILSGQDITNEEDKRSYDEFLALYNEIKAKFPNPEYSVTLTVWEKCGREVDGDEFFARMHSK